MLGGEGADSLLGGVGNDFLKGGPGADSFFVGAGVDLVRDFSPLEGDVLAVLSSTTMSYQQVGRDLNIIFNGGEATAILRDMTKDGFNESTDLVAF